MARDEELVGDLARGDEAALRELLRRYERPLSNFIYRHTGGRDVEDLYQETWLRVFRHASQFDDSRRFSTWLFHIAVNLCRDWHRHAAVAGRITAAAANQPATLGQVEEGVDAAQLLAVLPEPQREVLILRFYHDMSEAEAAEALAIPRGTVKSRMHHALARLAAVVKAGL